MREFGEWWDWYWHDNVDVRLWETTKQADWAIIRDYGYTKVWDAAREGMIPADQAIKVPPVEEWPEWATEFVALYRHKMQGNMGDCQVVYVIPRPAPAIPKWTPKVGDDVFFKRPNGYGPAGVLVMKISDITPSGRVEFKGLSNLSWDISQIKPFSPEKIGLLWEEI